MTKKTNLLKAGLLAVGVLAAGSFSANAGDKYLESVEQRLERLERELNVMRGDAKGKGLISEDVPVYVKPKSKFIEEVRLRGRIQWQFGYVAPTGNSVPGIGRVDDNYSTFEIRRARIGIEAKLMNKFSAMVEFNTGGGGVALNEAYIRYDGIDFVKPLVGFVKPRFGYEENTSSASIWTVERSNLTNALAVSQRIGIQLNGSYNIFNYSAGIFNNTAGGATQAAVPAVATSGPIDYIYNFSGGLDFTDMLGFKLQLRADYINASNSFGFGARGTGNNVNFRNNVSASVVTGFGPFDFVAEFMGGFEPTGNNVTNGMRNGNLYGFYVMPSFYVIPKKLQLVAQYTWMESKGLVGVPIVNLPGRYANRAFAPAFPGDAYQSVYGGVNYYINGNDLKLMLGLEWSELSGIPRGGTNIFDKRSAITIFTAVRMQF